MIDMFIVDTAEMSPRHCVKCGGNIGPFVDVCEMEIATVNGPIPYHIYLCKRMCARSVARVCGFAPGKKMQELAGAAEQLLEKEKEAMELGQRLDNAGVIGEEMILRLKERAERIEVLEGRVKQLQDRLTQEAQANLNLVGGNAA